MDGGLAILTAAYGWALRRANWSMCGAEVAAHALGLGGGWSARACLCQSQTILALAGSYSPCCAMEGARLTRSIPNTFLGAEQLSMLTWVQV